MIGLLAGCGAPDLDATVLYVSERDGEPQTWVAAPGEPRRRLIDRPGAVFPGDPDPQGTDALLVTADDDAEGHHEQLLLAPLAGGPARELCPPAGMVRHPAWSADGDWVVFESDALSFRDLFRVRRDGTGLERLTDARFGSFEPAVAPDGRIAFGSSRDGNAEIYVLDGAEQRRLTDDPADDVHPRWTPDGRIAWIATRSRRARVWTMAADGTDARPLRAYDDATDLDFAVSPDRRFAVVTQRDDGVGIEIVGPDGIVRVDGDGPDEHPTWSADGRWLVFTSSRGGNPDVWRVSADGKDPLRLTDDPAPEWLPRLVPPRG